MLIFICFIIKYWAGFNSLHGTGISELTEVPFLLDEQSPGLVIAPHSIIIISNIKVTQPLVFSFPNFMTRCYAFVNLQTGPVWEFGSSHNEPIKIEITDSPQSPYRKRTRRFVTNCFNKYYEISLL